MALSIPAQVYRTWLRQFKSPCVVNLPEDYEIVSSQLLAPDRVVFIIRSQTFPRISLNGPIPEFKAGWEGLRWARA
jgi:hypothetical protein